MEPKSDECDHCNWPTPDLTWVETLKPNGSGERMDRTKAGWLCEVCRSTRAGNLFVYGGPDGMETLSSVICWGINHLVSLTRPDPTH